MRRFVPLSVNGVIVIGSVLTMLAAAAIETPSNSPRAQAAIATARQRHGEAVRFARAAVAAEDWLVANDPPVWPVTARHMLGNALLSADHAAEAQKVFSEDLRKYPQNCTASAGLVAAELAQRSSTRASVSAQVSAHSLHCPK